MTTIRPWLKCSPGAAIASDVVELARVPCVGEHVRLGSALYSVGSVVHVVNGDCAADVYMHLVEPLPELPTGPQLALGEQA